MNEARATLQAAVENTRDTLNYWQGQFDHAEVQAGIAQDEIVYLKERLQEAEADLADYDATYGVQETLF